MKIRLGRLRQLIREEIDLGSVQFSPERIDDTDTTEDNTPEEDMLFRALDGWFTGNAVPSDLADTLQGLKRSKYADFFHDLRLEEAYRGISLSVAAASSLTGLPEETFKTDGEAQVDFVATGPGNTSLSSWTTEFEYAEAFAQGTYKDAPTRPSRLKPVMLVMCARVSDNPRRFLDLADIAGRIDSFRSWAHEEEALALGPIKVYRIVWTVKV